MAPIAVLWKRARWTPGHLIVRGGTLPADRVRTLDPWFCLWANCAKSPENGIRAAANSCRFQNQAQSSFYHPAFCSNPR